MATAGIALAAFIRRHTGMQIDMALCVVAVVGLVGVVWVVFALLAVALVAGARGARHYADAFNGHSLALSGKGTAATLRLSSACLAGQRPQTLPGSAWTKIRLMALVPRSSSVTGTRFEAALPMQPSPPRKAARLERSAFRSHQS